MELAQPWALVSLLSLPLIVLLHSLRPTRRRVELSSSWLWREALRQRRRGLGLEKLLRNLSLLLLLLFALLASLALADPQWLTRTADRGDVVVMIDVSASMQAEEGATTRFELARREAAALIDGLPAGARMLLMTSGRHAVLRSAFEDDRGLLHRQLAALEAGDEAGRPREALSLALSLLRNRERGRVYFLTDGAFEQPPAFGAVDVEYRLVGSAQDNVAITRFDLRREPDSEDRFEALVSVRSHAAAPVTFPVTVSLEERTLVEESVRLAPGEARTLVWSFRGSAYGRARAELGVDDALAADDRAYAVLSGDETLRVLLLGPDDPFLRSALTALPGVVLTRLDAVPRDWLEQELARHDVVVVDGLAMPELPPGAYLLVDTVPPGLPFAAGGRVTQPVVAGRGNSALLAQLDLTGLRIDEAARVTVDPAGDHLQRLFWSERTPLALAGIDGDRRFVYLGFAPARSNLPLKTAFPLFIRHSVEWLRPRGRRDAPTQVVAGEPVTIPVPPGRAEVIVRDPDSQAEVHGSGGGALLFDRTSRAGIYQYSFGYEAGAVQRYFAVNLTDEAESAINARGPVAGAAAAGSDFHTQGWVTLALWPYLAAAALVALGLEWCLLPRRVRRA